VDIGIAQVVQVLIIALLFTACCNAIKQHSVGLCNLAYAYLKELYTFTSLTGRMSR